MNFTATAALGTLVFTLLNLLKYARVWIWPDTGETRTDGLNGVITLLLGFAAGIGGVWIVAQTQFGSDITFGTTALSNLSGWSLCFIGLIATSILSTVYEVKRAIDQRDSAKTPALLRGTSHTTTTEPTFTLALPPSTTTTTASTTPPTSVPTEEPSLVTVGKETADLRRR